MAKRRRKDRFTLHLLVYALILMAICGVLLLVFHHYIDAYEASRPQIVVDAYGAALKDLPVSAREAISRIEADPEDGEADLLWAEDLVREATLVKDYVNSVDNEKLVYRLRAADGHAIGSVTFAVTGKGSYGMPVWEKTEEDFDFSAYCKTLEVTVPADYTVYLGSRALGDDCVTERELPYAALEECYLHYEGLPTMLHYKTPPFLGERELRVVDAQGRERSAEELTEAVFLDNASPELRERAETFLSKMIPAYVLFSADIQGRAKDYFNPLMNYVIYNSQLHTRMLQALENAGWGKTQSLKVTDIRLNFVTDLGEGRYLADVTYDSDVTTMWGTSAQMTDNARVVIFDLDGTLKADAIYHY